MLAYYRYVDDCLLIWSGFWREFGNFLKDINEVQPRIKFKAKKGGDRRSHLDLTIKIKNNRLKFEIFRKYCHIPTQ